MLFYKFATPADQSKLKTLWAAAGLGPFPGSKPGGMASIFTRLAQL